MAVCLRALPPGALQVALPVCRRTGEAEGPALPKARPSLSSSLFPSSSSSSAAAGPLPFSSLPRALDPPPRAVRRPSSSFLLRAPLPKGRPLGPLWVPAGLDPQARPTPVARVFGAEGEAVPRRGAPGVGGGPVLREGLGGWKMRGLGGEGFSANHYYSRPHLAGETRSAVRFDESS